MKKIFITSIIILLNLGLSISQNLSKETSEERAKSTLSALHKDAFVRTRELEKIDLQLLLTKDTVTLELFHDLTIVIQKVSDTEQSQGGSLWHGTLIEGEKGYVDLFLRNGMVSGSIYTLFGVFKLNGTLDGKLRVTELLRSEVDDEVHNHDEHDELHQEGEVHEPLEKETVFLGEENPRKMSRGTSLNPCVIDLMIVYPQVLEDNLGGPQATENEVLFRIAEANQVFVNSEVFIRFRLAHHQVANSVPVDSRSPADLRTDDVILALRDLYKADLVSFWNVGGAVGIAHSFSGGANNAYNVCSYNAVVSQYTFVHECGHNLGANHDRQQYYNLNPTSGSLNRAPHDKYGKSFINTRSIMSYSNCGDVAGATGGCSRIPYFTNPDIIVDGVAFGVAGTQQTYDPNGPANNARVLNENASVVEAFYDNSATIEYNLTVTNGSGSGTHFQGTSVNIVADYPLPGMIFDKWVGDISSITNVNNATTSITVNDNLTITATYKEGCLTTPDAPSVSNEKLCKPGNVTFTGTASGDGLLKWYSDEEGTNVLEEGNTFSVDVTETSSFYVKETSTAIVSKVGMEEKSDNGIYHPGGRHLIMDVTSAFTLKSAKVYAEKAGSITFELRNSNNELLLSKSIYVVVGESRVDLDFNIPVGDDLIIGTDEDALFLHRSKGSIAYPFVEEGIVSIKNSTNGTQYYYALYDWEIQTGSKSLCSSPATMVTVTIEECTGLSVHENENLILFPNPTSGIVNLELPEAFKLHTIEVTDIQGHTLLSYNNTYAEKIDLQSLKSGIYLVKVTGDKGSKVFKVELNQD